MPRMEAAPAHTDVGGIDFVLPDQFIEARAGSCSACSARMFSSLRTASRRYSSMALEYFCRMLGVESVGLRSNLLSLGNHTQQ
jgi:hypothetical protein